MQKMIRILQSCLLQENELSDDKLPFFLCLSLKYLILNGPFEEKALHDMLLSIFNLLKLTHVKGEMRNMMASLVMACYQKQNIEQTNNKALDLQPLF